MAQITVFQPQEAFLKEVKEYIDVKEENPTDDILSKWYTTVMDFQETQLPITDEELLIGSIESMVNISQTKLRPFGAYDVIKVQQKGKTIKILLLLDDEYEIIEE